MNDENADTAANGDENVALTFEQVNHQPCPNCSVGVLHVVTFDPEATHEIGQAVDPSATSGGAAQRRCLHCDYSDSIPLNPGPDYGKAA